MIVAPYDCALMSADIALVGSGPENVAPGGGPKASPLASPPPLPPSPRLPPSSPAAPSPPRYEPESAYGAPLSPLDPPPVLVPVGVGAGRPLPGPPAPPPPPPLDPNGSASVHPASAISNVAITPTTARCARFTLYVAIEVPSVVARDWSTPRARCVRSATIGTRVVQPAKC